MNKLIKILFTRPIARDVIPFRDSGEVPVCRRARRALICVWTPDPETGRLVCSWRRPSDVEGSLTQDAGEPPPALQIAA